MDTVFFATRFVRLSNDYYISGEIMTITFYLVYIEAIYKL
jgi:hypothetical protein